MSKDYVSVVQDGREESVQFENKTAKLQTVLVTEVVSTVTVSVIQDLKEHLVK